MPGVEMAGDYAAWNYFQSSTAKRTAQFVSRFRKRYGAASTTSDPMEAAYFGVYLWAQAVNEAESDNVDEVREAIRHQSLRAPEGIVSIDPENLHTWKTVRVGRINEHGQFDVVWSSGRPVRPVPFPPFRTQDAWLEFLDSLKARWGGAWSNSAATPAGAQSKGLDSGTLSLTKANRRGAEETQRTQKIHRGILSAPSARPLRLCGSLLDSRSLGRAAVRRPSISNRLIGWFLIIGLAPVLIVAVLTNYIATRSQTYEVSHRLRAIAQAKGEKIETYARERKRSVMMLARTRSVVECLQALNRLPAGTPTTSPQYRAIDESARQYLTDYTTGYANLYLFNERGEAAFSIHHYDDLGTNFYTRLNPQLSRMNLPLTRSRAGSPTLKINMVQTWHPNSSQERFGKGMNSDMVKDSWGTAEKINRSNKRKYCKGRMDIQELPGAVF